MQISVRTVFVVLDRIAAVVVAFVEVDVGKVVFGVGVVKTGR